MTLVIGLTGSIGMGKSTTSEMFADESVPVWDADAAVHRLYAKGGAAVAPMAKVFPSAIIGGVVDRVALKKEIAVDSDALKKIEAIVHPLLVLDRQAFLDRNLNAAIVLLDMPLLFETGADDWLDRTICVTAPPETQKARVLARQGMSEAQFDLILSNQMHDTEKRARADYVIETVSLDATRTAVRSLIKELRNDNGRA